MAGRRGRNLREGHKSEDIGVMFFRNFAAVAHVRNEDDIGIDAIVTLLRSDGVNLYAEDSLFVQIKSQSVETVSYNAAEIKWFIEQDLPLFFCIVDKANDTIKIFTSNRAFQIIQYPEIKELQITFAREECAFVPDLKVEDKKAFIDIGPPIIVSNLSKSLDADEADRIYETMKAWTKAEHKQTQLRKIGFSKMARWETNGHPNYYADIVHGNSVNEKRDLVLSQPFLEYLSNHLITQGEKNDYKTKIFKLLRKWFKEFDIKPSFELNKRVLYSDGKNEWYVEEE